MEERIDMLEAALIRAYGKIGALEAIVLMLVGQEWKRDPRLLALLKQMAAGDVPQIAPDLSFVPEAARERTEDDFAKIRKSTRESTIELANLYAEMLGSIKRS